MKAKTGLGKGLGALLTNVEFTKEKGINLIPQGTPENEDQLAASKALIKMIEPDQIRTNPYQPRHDFDQAALDDLKNSIMKHGLIQPITVRVGMSGYELISGERRLRASRAAGLKEVPCYVLDVQTSEQMLEMAIIENIQRENLNPIEIANGYQRLLEECRYTQEQVAERVGKDRSTVTNFLRILRLPESLQEMVREKSLSMGHAKALLALDDHAKMVAASREIVENQLSVRGAETLVRDIISGKRGLNGNGAKPKAEKKSVVTEEDEIVLKDTESKLRLIYGTQVRINPKTKNSGIIEFEFYNNEEFERLVELFSAVQQ